MDDDRGAVYDQLLSWLPTWALVQIAKALRDGHDMGYAEVTVIIRNGYAADLRVEEYRRIKDPTKGVG